MNRIDRLTAILIQLQSKRVVKAQEIADRFGISLRTVYRDVRALEEAGLPLSGEAGVGYSIMDGYRLPPVMFTREEALAFITAEKLVDKLTDASTQQSYRSAMYKIRAVLRSAEKNFLEDVESHIEVVQPYALFQPGAVDDALQTVLSAVAEKRVLRLGYTAFHSGEATTRCIEPVGVFYAGNAWHVIAYCRLRSDYRDFRADRMQKIEPLDETFASEHPTLKSFLGRLAEKEQLTRIVIRVSRRVAPYLGQQKFLFGFVSEREDGEVVEQTFLSAGPDVFVRWYAMFADHASIVEPQSLHALFDTHVQNISKKS